jgi:dipeptidyl aminopeptidase/acylaminoacyl peptidase
MAAQGKKTLVLTTGLQSPPALDFVNLVSNRIDNLAESYPQLRATQLADARRHTYKVGNNLSLSGVLTVPRGKEARDLPLVVLPQGGFGYGLADFDWFGQFLAHRGYAVFQPGMRSTKGFEEVTDIEELKAWTNDVQEDIASGVDDLIAKGIVNRKRVCIAGGGTDGYVALMAMAFGGDRYACAMALTPLTNLNTLISNAQYTSKYSSFLAINKISSTFVRNLAKFSGALLDELSPVRQTGRIHGPILLVDVDKLGWNSQSLNMAEGLRDKKNPVDVILIKDEDGSVSRVESRIAWLDAVDKFLSAHLAN